MNTFVQARNEHHDGGGGNAAGRTSIDEDMIHDLVHAFYAHVRTDHILGPVFERVIGGNWDAHLARMCDFWSSVMLTSGRYKGNPMAAHMRLKDITPAHFERWLALFARTAGETCPKDAADAFAARADNIARSLQLGMFFRLGAKSVTSHAEKSDVP